MERRIYSSCPTSFYARAFSKSKTATLELYQKKSDIKTADACATYCGQQAECQSALYNHDTKTCSLSNLSYGDCRQRYNTFHLKTDGADSLSIIGCIDVCRDKFAATDPTKLNIETNGFRLKATPILPNIVTSHGQNHINSNEDFSNGSQLYVDGNIPAIQPIIPVNYPIPSPLSPSSFAHSLDSKIGVNVVNKNTVMRLGSLKPSKAAADYVKATEPRRGVVSEFGESGGHSEGYVRSPLFQNVAQRMVNGHVIINTSSEPLKAQEPTDSNGLAPLDDVMLSRLGPMDEHRAHAFLQAINHLNVMQKQLKRSNKMDQLQNVNVTSWKLERPTIPEATFNTAKVVENSSSSGKVRFNAQPLSFQEIFGRASNAREGAVLSNDTTVQVDEKIFSKVMRSSSNGSEFVVHSGGFVTLLQPGKSDVPIGSIKDSDRRYSAGTTVNRQSNIDASAERTIKMMANKITVANPPVGDERENAETPVRIPSEPIVINGKILTTKEKVELMKQEHTTTTTTTTVAPWSPAGLIGESSINEPELVETANLNSRKPKIDDGYLNKFVIHGIASTMNRHYDEDSNGKKINGVTEVTTTGTPLTVVCFRSIAQQRLIHAAIRRVDNVTLNGCRCECAQTWKNETKVIGIPQEQHYCKSLQYNVKTRSCVLNSADHNGKYDLIYDKHVDYYYVSCQIPQLVHTARRKCKTKNAGKTKAKSAGTLSKTNAEKNQFTTPKTTTVPTTTTTTTISDRPTVLTTETESTVMTTEATTQRFDKLIKSEEAPDDETTRKSIAEIDRIDNENCFKEKIVHAKRLEIVQVVTPKSDLIKSTISTTTSKLTTPTTASTAATITKAATKKIVTTTKSTPTTVTETTTIKSSTATTTTAIAETTKSNSELKSEKSQSEAQIPKENREDCFERIAGHAMNATAGAVVRDVTLEQCKCACAGSILSQRRSFQCSSATYFHKERECILNLSNRQQAGQFFIRNPEESTDTQITYLGLLCPPAKSLDNLNNEGSCVKPSDQNTEPTTLTMQTTAATPHTDDCFLEMPNYVLEGPALAIETNVTVEECKCYCVDSENRYGTICQSILYYFESATCLLNKENRITDPNQFTFNGQSNVMHSYFDYRCHVENNTLSMYVEQVCQVATQLTVKNLLKNKASSLNIDEKSREAKSERGFEDHPKSKALRGEIKDTAKLTTISTPITITSRHSSTVQSAEIHAEKKKSNSKSRLEIKTEKPKNDVTEKLKSDTIQEVTVIPTSTAKTQSASSKPKRPIFADQHLHDQMELEERETKLAGRKKSNDNEDPEYEEEEAEEEEGDVDSDYDHKRKANDYQSKSTAKIVTTAAGKERKDKSKNLAENLPDINRKNTENFEEPSSAGLIDNDNTNNSKSDKIAEVEELDGDISDTKSKANRNENGKPKGKNIDSNTVENFVDTERSEMTLWTKSNGRTTVGAVTAVNGTTTTKLTPTSTVSTSKIGGEKEKPFEYPAVGPCQYSALYQTVFNGFRMIKRVMVKSPLQCFAACHAERCRSANLVQAEGAMKYCELFRDSIVDFRRTDVLGFDRGAVHFDSIQCQRADDSN